MNEREFQTLQALDTLHALAIHALTRVATLEVQLQGAVTSGCALPDEAETIGLSTEYTRTLEMQAHQAVNALRRELASRSASGTCETTPPSSASRHGWLREAISRLFARLRAPTASAVPRAPGVPQ